MTAPRLLAALLTVSLLAYATSEENSPITNEITICFCPELCRDMDPNGRRSCRRGE